MQLESIVTRYIDNIMPGAKDQVKTEKQFCLITWVPLGWVVNPTLKKQKQNKQPKK